MFFFIAFLFFEIVSPFQLARGAQIETARASKVSLLRLMTSMHVHAMHDYTRWGLDYSTLCFCCVAYSSLAERVRSILPSVSGENMVRRWSTLCLCLSLATPRQHPSVQKTKHQTPSQLVIKIQPTDSCFLCFLSAGQ
jgi:hypothetical protein